MTGPEAKVTKTYKITIATDQGEVVDEIDLHADRSCEDPACEAHPLPSLEHEIYAMIRRHDEGEVGRR